MRLALIASAVYTEKEATKLNYRKEHDVTQLNFQGKTADYTEESSPVQPYIHAKGRTAMVVATSFGLQQDPTLSSYK